MSEMMTAPTNNQETPQVAPHGSFIKTLVHSGCGLIRPNEGTTCAVRITQLVGDADSTLIGYQLQDEIHVGDGEGSLSHLIDSCLETMSAGETCTMEVSSDSLRKILTKDALNSSNDCDIDVDALPQQPLVLRIELRSFTRDKDIHEMTVDDKLDRASGFKTKGSSCFSSGKLHKAETFYIRALKYMLTINLLEMAELSVVTLERLKSLKCACLLNMAACKLKYRRYEHVISHCTKALTIYPNNAKGLFRRGVAYMELQEYEKAKEDFDCASGLAPNDIRLKQQKQILKNRMKILDAKYAKAMCKMFDTQ